MTGRETAKLALAAQEFGLCKSKEDHKDAVGPAAKRNKKKQRQITDKYNKVWRQDWLPQAILLTRDEKVGTRRARTHTLTIYIDAGQCALSRMYLLYALGQVAHELSASPLVRGGGYVPQSRALLLGLIRAEPVQQHEKILCVLHSLQTCHPCI